MSFWNAEFGKTMTKRAIQALNWYRLRLQVMYLDLMDRLLARPVTGNAPVVVSLTTHGQRLATVHTSIQSIVAGCIRPSRLILWLNQGPDGPNIDGRLKRLQKRGLEIRYASNYGPHTKYYPYVELVARHDIPLVTADDDVIYPKDWLKGLVNAYSEQPGLIHCYWAKRIRFKEGQLLPYLKWPFVHSVEPSILNFALGVSGVIYPPEFLQRLRDAADDFKTKCPKADDIWLHAMALRSGYRVKQMAMDHVFPRLVPFTQGNALHHDNHLPAGNDAQIAATYTEDDLARLASASVSG